MLRLLLAIALCCVSQSAYAQTKMPAGGPSAGSPLQKQLVDLRAQVATLEQKVTSLEARVELQQYMINSKQDRQNSIPLNLAEHTFQRLDTDSGFFLVSVAEVVPYLNGYKIRLKIGNPSAAAYSGVKLMVKWSTAYDSAKYTEASYNEWKKGLQEKEMSLVDTLEAGRWNSVELILAPATTEQLGVVTLSMSTDTLSLGTTR